MTYEYFSDKELGSKELSSEEVPGVVWNSIVVIYNQFVSNSALAGNFPYECPDGRGVCGCSQTQLEDVLKGEIPDLLMPIVSVRNQLTNNSFQEYPWDDEKKEEDKKKDDVPNKYAILDFLQFLHKNIKDPEELVYHSYYGHSHYSFSDGDLFKVPDRGSVNPSPLGDRDKAVGLKWGHERL